AARSRSSAREQGLTHVPRVAPAGAACGRSGFRAQQAVNNKREVPVRAAPAMRAARIEAAGRQQVRCRRPAFIDYFSVGNL
ncbi:MULTISPECIES: hypothetical protein, partial [unclassified Burkholderia]|uniref:hypothetical protein n=1 Tax=Burkholderia sp. LMG 13014 TaxID=2709306 RepID=UPI001963DDF6